MWISSGSLLALSVGIAGGTGGGVPVLAMAFCLLLMRGRGRCIAMLAAGFTWGALAFEQRSEAARHFDSPVVAEVRGQIASLPRQTLHGWQFDVQPVEILTSPAEPGLPVYGFNRLTGGPTLADPPAELLSPRAL